MKQLISADTLRAAHAAGQTRIAASLPDCIVTPEARVVAERLGVEIVECTSASTGNSPSETSSKAAAQAAPQAATAESCSLPSPSPSDDDPLARIRAAVMARLPANAASADVIDQLVRKVAGEHLQTEPTSASQPGGIKCVKGQDVRMGIFDGAGPDARVGIADVITGVDGSSMAAGFMQWENAFFPWTLNYDEIDMVLEGELHIRCDGQTTVGRAGDVMFIPKGSQIEFGTPTSVRFLYVAYPANWQEC